MKIVHVTGAYPPTSFSTGPPQQVHALAKALRQLGVDVRVVTTNFNGPGVLDVPTDRWMTHEDVPVFYGRRLPGTPDVSLGTWRALRASLGGASAVHVTGIFGWLTVAVDLGSGRVPVIISPRGSLDPDALAYGAGKKQLFLRLGGRRALRRAAAIHVTSEMERRHVETLLPGALTATVPNGVVVPAATRTRTAADVLFLGRIHAKKNVVALVRAWARIAGHHPASRLILAGPDDRGHRAEVERVAASEGVAGTVEFPGFVVGEAKESLFARAACLVLPSHTENFGNVVAESLARGVPVVASTGTPWSGVIDRECGAWVEPKVDAMAAALGAMLHLTARERAAMGERGRRWMIEEFSWASVASRMRSLYLDVVSRRKGIAS
jgi:glycosyltransferase involved in cell wall biosynthesis